MDQLNEVFRFVFDDDDIVVKPETTAADIDEWNSLSHITLISAIESSFSIRFTTGEILDFKNVGELAACIERKKT